MLLLDKRHVLKRGRGSHSELGLCPNGWANLTAWWTGQWKNYGPNFEQVDPWEPVEVILTNKLRVDGEFFNQKEFLGRIADTDNDNVDICELNAAKIIEKVADYYRDCLQWTGWKFRNYFLYSRTQAKGRLLLRILSIRFSMKFCPWCKLDSSNHFADSRLSQCETNLCQ